MYHLVRSISVRVRGLISLILAVLLVIFSSRLPGTWVSFAPIFVAAVSILAGMRMDFTANEMEEAIQEAVRQKERMKRRNRAICHRVSYHR